MPFAFVHSVAYVMVEKEFSEDKSKQKIAQGEYNRIRRNSSILRTPTSCRGGTSVIILKHMLNLNL